MRGEWIPETIEAYEQGHLRKLSRAAYGGTALAFRDRLVIDWNSTQQNHTFSDQKRIYCELCQEEA